MSISKSVNLENSLLIRRPHRKIEEMIFFSKKLERTKNDNNCRIHKKDNGKAIVKTKLPSK